VMRVVSECLSSNGSSLDGLGLRSTWRLMDAVLPLKAPRKPAPPWA